MEFVIDSDILGLDKNLLCSNGNYKWIKSIPENTWYFDGTYKNDGWCLDTLLKINHCEVDICPDKRYVNVVNQIMPTSQLTPPWGMLMTRQHLQDHVKKITRALEDITINLNEDYYKGIWVPSTAIFERLKPCYINKNLWHHWMFAEVGNKPIIKTFRPNKHGHTKNVIYNRFGTRTGRLTIESGPNILTLRRDARQFLTSRYPNGKIVQYDFSALEARIVLYESGLQCDELDLYGFLSKQIFKGKMNRDAIKLAVISELYGQSKFSLGQNLEIGGNILDGFITKIKDFFNFDVLMKKVKEDFIKTGVVTNRYGRPIKITDPLDHILFNSYAQSTGVDVTLLGFEELCKILPDDAIPIFLLHDALLLDVPDIESLEKVIWLKVPGYTQSWPLKLEQISPNNIQI